MRKNNTVIYTAIFGDYDDLKEPQCDIHGCDLLCFTDNQELKFSKLRIIHKKKLFDDDNNRSAKIFKILPHLFLSDYEYSIWIDGSVLIKSSKILELVDKYLDAYDLALFAHPLRNCVYDELSACIKFNKDDPEIMRRQVNRYQATNYPAENGLTANSVILRRHNSESIKMISHEWWNEIVNHSKRDQLSLNYILWKYQINYNILDFDIRDNKYFRIMRHKKHGKLSKIKSLLNLILL